MPESHWPLEHTDLASELLLLREFDRAEVQLRTALAQDPEFPVANDRLCNLLIYRGRAPEALPSCAQAVASQPDSAVLHHQLGVSLEAAGRRAEAIAEYRTALRLSPGYPKSVDALAKALKKQAARREESE